MAQMAQTRDNASPDTQTKKKRKWSRDKKRSSTASVDGSIASRETPDSANEPKSLHSPVKNDSVALEPPNSQKEEKKIFSSQNKALTEAPSTPPPAPKTLPNGTPKSPLKSPLRIRPSPSPSHRKVIQFSDQPDADDSSDEDFTPSPSKRRKKPLAKLGHSPTRLLTSPRKVHNKDELEKKKRDLLEERRKLPIWSAREPLLKMIEENQVTVLLGETGCGKSTQLPQFLLPRYGAKGIIGITQPRRVAAVSLAKRVAEENGTHLRNKVGYSIRFDDATSSNTLIKYMTDGMLLREHQSDPTLSAYSVIVLDEAHERSLRTDLLMGLIKLLLPQRPDLRVVVMSATLDAERFAQFFEVDGKKAEIGFVQGREYPVQVLNTHDLATANDGSGAGDYIEGALKCILSIHMSNEEGDILVFLTGIPSNLTPNLTQVKMRLNPSNPHSTT
jgi:HrpA-like RNA helicase